MVRPGGIFCPLGTKDQGKGRQLVVVYLLRPVHDEDLLPKDSEVVYYDALTRDVDGGEQDREKFALEWEYVATMTFAGAWQSYKRERLRHYALRFRVRTASEQVARALRPGKRDRWDRRIDRSVAKKERGR